MDNSKLFAKKYDYLLKKRFSDERGMQFSLEKYAKVIFKKD